MSSQVATELLPARSDDSAQRRFGALGAWLRDVVALTKPRVTSLNLLMTLGAMLLAPGALGWRTALSALLGTGLAIGSANVLNMLWERHSDGLMRRTRLRPLPDGRLAPVTALVFGVLLGALAMLVLAWQVNALTAALGGIALLGYVCVYTPLKQRTPAALLVGAIPGAMPPLMGWTAATGEIQAGGLALFAILFCWQLPHFLAISVYLRADYERAGIRTVSVTGGEHQAKLLAVASSALLIPISLLLLPLDVAGWIYAAASLLLGVWLLVGALRGLGPGSGARWARRFFLATLIYLPALTAALVADGLIL